MAGILDSKSRIFDTVLTAEGRRQLAVGNLRFSFASFTDGGTFYESDISSGSSDASSRIFLEAPSSLPRDQITFETDDSGKLLPFFGNGDRLYLVGNKIGSSGSIVAVSGENFSSLAGEILSSSVDNFKNLFLLGTQDLFSDDEGFSISHQDIDFTVTKTFPFDVERDIVKTHIDDIPSFFQDGRFDNIPNFRYLPPVNVGTTGSIGEFPIRGKKAVTIDQLDQKLNQREKVVVSFPVTSKDNNLLTQIFEISNGAMEKLDVIDFGEFTSADQDHPLRQVFFVGKVFISSTGNGTYVNQFTVIFD